MGEGGWPSSPGLGERNKVACFPDNEPNPLGFTAVLSLFFALQRASPQAIPQLQVTCVQVPQPQGRKSPFQLEKCEWVETPLFFLSSWTRKQTLRQEKHREAL